MKSNKYKDLMTFYSDRDGGVRRYSFKDGGGEFKEMGYDGAGNELYYNKKKNVIRELVHDEPGQRDDIHGLKARLLAYRLKKRNNIK